jgi:hypothetical protein
MNPKLFSPLINLPFAEVDIKKVTELQGFNSINDRYVYRYKPESALKRDPRRPI